jgi:hypothetical protein
VLLCGPYATLARPTAVRKYWDRMWLAAEAGIAESTGQVSSFSWNISPLHAAARQYVRLIPTRVNLYHMRMRCAVMRAREPRQAAFSPIALVAHSPKTASNIAADQQRRHGQLRWL